MVPVMVAHRHWPDRPRPAVRIGDVVMSDIEYHRHAGVRRYFWLLGYDAQLIYEPFGWTKSWYIDIVGFGRGTGEGVEKIDVVDRYIDLVVEGHGPSYRLLDLDELADAQESGDISMADTRAALRGVQRFLEAYLHRGAPFPPPQLLSWFADDHDYPPLPRGKGT